MPLFRPDHHPDVDPTDAVAVVHRFLLQCRAWALENEIPRRQERLQQSLSPEDAARLHEWVAYLRMTEHAIREIESGHLDHWFTPQPDPEK